VTELRTVWDFATAALREQSPSVLRGGLIWLLRADDGKDPRDLMLGLAPFHVPIKILNEPCRSGSRQRLMTSPNLTRCRSKRRGSRRMSN
jgi:hypothetical protein